MSSQQGYRRRTAVYFAMFGCLFFFFSLFFSSSDPAGAALMLPKYLPEDAVPMTGAPQLSTLPERCKEQQHPWEIVEAKTFNALPLQQRYGHLVQLLIFIALQEYYKDRPSAQKSGIAIGYRRTLSDAYAGRNPACCTKSKDSRRLAKTKVPRHAS